MKMELLSSIILAGTTGVAGVASTVYTTTVLAAEERAVAAHDHEKVKLPTKRLMVEMEKRTYNILEGILIGNYKQVSNEANAILSEANKINENFFPRNPEIDAWYRRSQDLDPKNIEAITKLKEEFNGYVKRIDAAVKEIQKAAEANDQEGTLNAFTGLIKNSCFECHRRLRDTK